jgi:Tfp pilus assembly protein PilF
MDKNSNKSRSVLIYIVLTAATLAVFYQVYSFGFVNLDDPIYVYKNPNIQSGITPESVKWAFTTGYANFWHPLTWLSHMLDWQLFGNNAAGHHLVNLFFHIANTLLLFIVLKQMTSALWQSAFAAALFALHPLHVESVAWVAERKDVLSTFFWILTMWAYLRYIKQPNIFRYLLTLLVFALGLMAKPMLVTLPFVLLLLDYWPLNRINRFQWQIIYRLVLEKIPFIVISAVSSAIAFLVQQRGGSIASLAAIPLKFRVYNALISYAEYIYKMFWPSKLAVFYPYPGSDISILYVIISVGFLLAVTVLVLRFAKNHRYLVTGWFWYIGTLVPVIGIVQVGSHAMADRYTYITLTGLFIIIAWGLPELLEKWRYRKIVLWVSSLIVLSALTVCTYFQTRYWKDDIALYQHTLKVTRNNHIAHFGITEVLLEQGRFDEVIQHNLEALRIEPNYADAMHCLGTAFYRTGKIDQAIDCYEKAIEMDPGYVEVYSSLGMALAEKGRFDEAISLYNKALQIAPDSINIRLNLGVALTSSGKLEQAAGEYEKILSIQPQNALAHSNFGIVLSQQGKYEQAIMHFKQAIEINPDDINLKNNLAMALKKQKQQNTGN